MKALTSWNITNVYGKHVYKKKTLPVFNNTHSVSTLIGTLVHMHFCSYPVSQSCVTSMMHKFKQTLNKIFR